MTFRSVNAGKAWRSDLHSVHKAVPIRASPAMGVQGSLHAQEGIYLDSVGPKSDPSPYRECKYCPFHFLSKSSEPLKKLQMRVQVLETPVAIVWMVVGLIAGCSCVTEPQKYENVDELKRRQNED